MPREPAVPVRDAATVLLVRDAPALEVLMLERNADSIFAGGASVFPGGALDPGDHEFTGTGAARDLTDPEASALLDVANGGLAFWVAALRECFEEAGILLARHADDRPLDLDDPALAARLDEHRHAVDTGARPFAEVLEAESLVLNLGALHYLSRWITPEGAPRRYDTRFFVAAAPDGQVATPDGREAVAAGWVEPGAALERFANGAIDLIYPTLKSLDAISAFASAGELLDAVAADRERVSGAEVARHG